MTTSYRTASTYWNFDGDVVPVKITTTADVILQTWIYEMMSWAKEHRIPIKWQGESTHTRSGKRWHEADFLIQGEENRTLFLLRWS